MSKKIIASVLAVTFAFSMVGSAGAATVEELEAQIAQLTALIAQLQAQLAGQTTPAITGLCLSSNLSQGMTNAEVKTLQQGLNQDSRTQLAVSGAGAPGYETTYFGPLTKAAVIKFQELYSSEVLASWGLTKGTGFVGSTTRAKFNALYCTPAPTTTTTIPGGTTTTTTVAGATEGTLTVTQYAIPASGTVTVYGGNTNKEVAAYKMKATNSDIRVKRVLVQVGITNDFPWRDLSSISLWDGSTLLKEIAVNSSNLTEVTWATTYQVTFDGLDLLLPKDSEKIISLKVSALAVPQYTGAISTLIPANGVRGVDSLGLNVYGPATALTAYNFTTAAADSPAITLSLATDNPPAGNVVVSKTATTRVDLLKFTVKVENIDATFKSGTITVDTNSNSAMSAVELYDGSTLLASAATTTTGDLTWSTFTLPVSAGTTKTLTVKGVVSASTTISGETIGVTGKANAALSGVDANGASLTLTHSALTGNTMTVYTAAPIFALANASAVRSDSSTTTINDVGDFTIGVSITANGGDIYVASASNATHGAGKATEGFLASIDDGAGTLSSSSTTWSCDSNAIEEHATGTWRIPSGQTAVCTVNVHAVNSSANGYYNVSISKIYWDDAAAFTSPTGQASGLTALKAPTLLLQF